MTPSEVRAAYISAHHECPDCGAKHAPAEISDNYRKHCVSCLDCDEICVDDYFLLNDVWESLGLSRHDGRLHLECVERRLGRLLTLDDFSEAPINNAIRWAANRFRRG